ncbi:MAG: mechanosensitive ion channel family protein [Bradymonadaceae bacterium]|nr:mechanosensitive ion channel family protein [Lujinxingiaceae bacterium]
MANVGFIQFPVSILAQAAPDVSELAERFEGIDFGKIFAALIIVFVAFMANRLASAALDRIGEGQAKRRLMFKKVQSFTRLGIFMIASYMVLATFLDFQEDRAALIGLGGTLAVAIGFALKDTASSLMAGILILIDQPFQVGDRVQFQDIYGEVKEIGLRSVRIVTLDDSEVSIPNNKFLTEAVSSSNAGALDMMVVLRFHIAMSADFELARRIVYEACITSKFVFLKKPVVTGVHEKFLQPVFATVIVCRAYVIDARYEMAFDSDVTQQVRRAFREHKIYAPYVRQYSVRDDQWDDFDNQVDDAQPSPGERVALGPRERARNAAIAADVE